MASGMLAALMVAVVSGTLLQSPPSAEAQTPPAELSALSLSSGTLRPTFAAATTEYRAAVHHNVTQITVTAAAASGVTVEYLVAADIALDDADTGTSGFQVDLGVGETKFLVKVTSGSTTESYTVSVERNSAHLFGWTPTRDINALEDAGNANPQGIWSDATTMWVADDDDDKLYAYTLSGGARDTNKEFNLHADYGDSAGLWSDGTTIWVADDDDDKLYAYTLSGGARDTNKEFNLHADNGDSAGLWSDGTTIWVANNIFGANKKVFAYTLSDGTRDANKEFAVNWAAVGIWSNGETMWVVSRIGDYGIGDYYEVVAYIMDLNPDRTAGPNHGRRDLGGTFTPNSNFDAAPMGIWSDSAGAIWITALDTPKVDSYNMLPSSSTSTTLSALTINDGTGDATLRPAFVSTTVAYRTSVTAAVNRVTVSATASDITATVRYLDEKGEELEDVDSNTDGFQVYAAVWETTIQILVTAQDGTALINEVVVERDSSQPGGWTPTNDLHDLDAVTVHYPRGIWSDGTTMWITNTGASTLFAYTLATSARDTSKDISLDSDNTNAWGIWSDGTTIWVVDSTRDKVYAYTLASGERDAEKEFSLHASNDSPWGIWSDGTTAWVTDEFEGVLYAYTLADGTRDASKEFALTANTRATAVNGLWSDGTTIWIADRDGRFARLIAYKLADGAHDPARDFTLSQSAPQGVWGKGDTVWVANAGFAIFGEEKAFHRVYSYRLPLSDTNDVTLSSLSVSPSPPVPSFTATLRPKFAYPWFSYGIAVPNQTSRVTISAVASNSETTIAYLDANGDALEDADTTTAGIQVDVAVGKTTISMTLASGDTALTYSVFVERDSAILYGWTPTKDFNNLLEDNPSLAGDGMRGLWADETTLYVSPNDEPNIFAYTRATGARDTNKDIATNRVLSRIETV